VSEILLEAAGEPGPRGRNPEDGGGRSESQTMIEIMGIVATVIAVLGVLRNNRRRRDCFILWLVSNLLTAGIHMYSGIWSLFARDLIFMVLAMEGLILWGKTCQTAAHTRKNPPNRA